MRHNHFRKMNGHQRKQLGVHDVALQVGPSTMHGGLHFKASYQDPRWFGFGAKDAVLQGYSDARGHIQTVDTRDNCPLAADLCPSSRLTIAAV